MLGFFAMANSVMANETVDNVVNGKTKAEWKELYTQAGCYDLNIFAREICKTKVFQLENYKNVKEDITKVAKKLNLN